MTEASDAVVVGGGFAGLAAAVALAERGLRVTVLERKPALGGRACSFLDEESGEAVDNGQHVMMGCYAETLKFLDRIGTRGHLASFDDLAIEMRTVEGTRGILRTARLPGPFHMSAAVMRYRLLDRSERMRLVWGGMRMLALRSVDHAGLERISVVALMDKLKQGERARTCFWYPLAIATLNEDPRLASAALLAEVLRRAFFSRRRDSAFVYARVGLSDLYCGAAADFIGRHGGRVETRAAVEALELGESGPIAAVRIRDGRRIAARNFVVAVPAPQLLRLLPEGAAASPFFGRIAALGASPIICVHAWFDREVTQAPFIGFVGTTTQWLFNKRRIFANAGRRLPGYLSFVISGARDLVDRSNDELARLVLDDLERVVPEARGARAIRTVVIKEKQATMAPAPGCERLRPPVQTPLRNLFLAGDWVATGLPATIESAVASGHGAAAALLDAAGAA